MQFDVDSLTKIWIQYLKSGKIVELKSDPKTGKLKYNRPVTFNDLEEFLDVKTEYSAEEIRNAVSTVLARNNVSNSAPKIDNLSSNRGLSTWMHHGTTPGDKPADQKSNNNTDGQAPKSPSRLGYSGNRQQSIPHDKDSISDIDYREISPDDPQHSQKNKKRRFNEDIVDNSGIELSEKDIETIFKILTGSTAPAEKSQVKRKHTPSNPEKEYSQEERIEDLNKVKRIIRDTMTDSQRKLLWRILTDTDVLSEDSVDKTDINGIFKAAVKSNQSGGIFSRMFKGAAKKDITVADLHALWKEDGYPNDIEDIKLILKSQGFSDREIKKAFIDVFGKSDKTGDVDVPGQGNQIRKIAKLINDKELTQDVVKYMKSAYNFSESVILSKKLLVEDIRSIFSIIVKSERTQRDDILRQLEVHSLGRSKK